MVPRALCPVVPSQWASCARSLCCRVPAGIPVTVEAPVETPPGNALNSLSAAPLAQQWPRFGGARQAGAVARGCCGSFLSHAVAAGVASCSPWGARGRTALLGLSASPAREAERAPGCWWHPTAEPRGGWQLGSGYVCRARNSPRSAHRPGIMPVASVGEQRAGCLFCLPPSLLPRG